MDQAFALQDYEVAMGCNVTGGRKVVFLPQT